MTRKYLVELRDKLHIATAEKIEREGEVPELRLLRPRDDDSFTVEDENYGAYWQWLKDEKSFLPGDPLDFCFLYPPALSPTRLIEAVKCLNANIAEETEIHVGDARSFLHLTDRNLEKKASDGEKTLLFLSNGDKLCAMGAGGKGIADEPVKKEALPAPQHAVRRREHSRPKAFQVAQAPVKPEKPPVSVIPMPKTRQVNDSVKEVLEVSRLADSAGIPKATAADIQIGIKRITEEQCQDVDFRN